MSIGYGVFCAGGVSPDRKELLISSLTPSHEKLQALPGRTPLAPLRKILSSTRLLSNICLPPVRFKLATSVPLALSTCARNGAESFGNLQRGWWRMIHVRHKSCFGILLLVLFPAWIESVASSKGDAHKGKSSFASGGTHLLNQIQGAFSVYITTPTCCGLV